MAAYYSENDPFAAAWLRELIKDGLIADGEVDERSIEEVQPGDLRGFVQCHFFAGIGGWSLALRLAGWPDDRPVWTGSCPCQPFSSAGSKQGGGDDRHLWPYWARLIRERRPFQVFGEQVEAAVAYGWLDAVFDDLEAMSYACGTHVLPAASVGADHGRHRIWFVADSDWSGRSGQCWQREDGTTECGGLGDSAGERRWWEQKHADIEGTQGIQSGRSSERRFWHRADFIRCGDGKTRRIEPGTSALAHGVPARVGRLRGYGNAIVPQVAAAFIEAYLEARLA